MQRSSTLVTSRQDKRFQPFHHSLELVLLNGTRWIDVLGTNSRAFAHKSTAPDSFGMSEDRNPFIRALVARIQVVALGQSNCGRTDKHWIKANHGASRVAQRAVDTHAELSVVLQLLGGLPELTLVQRHLVLADEPGLYLLQLHQEIAQFSY